MERLTSSDVHSLGLTVLDAMRADTDAEKILNQAVLRLFNDLAAIPVSRDVKHILASAMGRFRTDWTKADRAQKMVDFHAAVMRFMDAAREADDRPQTNMALSVTIDSTLEDSEVV